MLSLALFAFALICAFVAWVYFELAGEACGQREETRAFTDGHARRPDGYRLTGAVCLVLALAFAVGAGL